MISDYIALTKPNIIFGNALTGVAGFLLACHNNVNVMLLCAVLLGLSCIIASACVCNNYIDRFIDAKMARTKDRSLVKKTVSIPGAISFALILLMCGNALLLFYTNLFALCIAMSGFLIYVLLYSLLKHSSTKATLIGSIAGAVPPIVGYAAVQDSLDLTAYLLFFIVMIWQMPHFYAIALYRLEDYASASIPVLPVVHGMHTTKIQMFYYICAFLMATLLLGFLGNMGYIYFIVTTLLGLYWLRLSLQGFDCPNNILWARTMFLYSLVVITLLCVVVSIDALA